MRLVPWNYFRPSSNFITDRFKKELLLWIFVNLYLFLPYRLVCVLQPCGHLLGKGWPFGSPVYDVVLCFSHFAIWCLGSGLALDCIDSWSLPSSLLWIRGLVPDACLWFSPTWLNLRHSLGLTICEMWAIFMVRLFDKTVLCDMHCIS